MTSTKTESWNDKGGSYISPLSYVGVLGDEDWNADLSSEVKKALPQEGDSSIVKTAKVLGAVLLTASGLFFMLKRPNPSPVVENYEASKWMQRAETLDSDEDAIANS